MTLAKRRRFQYRVRVVKSDVERCLRVSEDFNVCLEDIYRIVERFDKRCVPLTISQILRLKALHLKIWGYSVVLCDSV